MHVRGAEGIDEGIVLSKVDVDWFGAHELAQEGVVNVLRGGRGESEAGVHHSTPLGVQI